MNRKLVLEFTKMNGAGNDFIVIDNRFYHFSDDELSALARQYCPRRFGIGADGVLAFANPADDAHDYRMVYYNADGTRGSMCGNGARCLARFARDAGMGREELLFESDAGVYRALVDGEANSRVRLYVQPPKNYNPDILLRQVLPDGLGTAHYIWPGVEHVVFFVEDLADVPVEAWGRVLRHDAALAPAGANVNFVQVTSAGAPSALSVRTYEKGVEAETLACGTGAMASALVGRLTGRLESAPVNVQMRGGLLRVGFALEGSDVSDLYLEGPVESVYRGTVYV